MRNVLILLVFTLVTCTGTAQLISSSDPSFRFQDGVYLTIDDYKNNKPALKYNQFCSKDGSPIYDFTIKPTLYFRNDSGIISSIKASEIFGYAANTKFFIKLIINRNYYFSQLMVLGRLSHFVSQIQQYYTDPYNNMPRGGNVVLMQFVFDYDTGNIYPFTPENMSFLLKKDDTLYEEYLALSKKKKKNFMFLYLRKFNELHPVFFPQ